MTGPRRDMSGERHGNLIVQEQAPHIPYRKVKWVCLCDCGRTTTVDGFDLRSGHTKSCGCLIGKSASQRFKKHGRSRTPEYECWLQMKRRCLEPHRDDYPNYGGRGITVCDRWMVEFDNFYTDMGPRPSRHHSIERCDNDADYSPENCRWATNDEQANNKRTTRYVEYRGERISLANACRRAGKSHRYFVVYQRLRNGMDLESALEA